MNRIFLFFCLLASALGLSAQSDAVLMTINGRPIYASEFLYIYQKNNQEANTADVKTMDEYLDLFVNFKLKVAEAESQGIDTTEAFFKELKGYRGQAAQKYLRDEQALDSLVKLSHHRMQYMRRARHIVIACGQNASDSAREAAMEQINDLRTRALAGEDFAALAHEYSQDPSAKENDGELGWVIPFRYVYSFEDAIYNTPVGEITPVFVSPYGVHIALVEEEQLTQEVHAAHIMKMVKKGDDDSDLRAKQQIDSIYEVLQAGANFEQTAMNLSDDKGTAVRGGDLGWFSKGMMVPEFENTVYSLDEGGISTPFRSQYGWHIAILYAKREVQPLDSIHSQVMRQVQRDQRVEEADKAFIRRTRAEYHLSDNLSDDEVRQYADDHLEDKYSEFRHLVQEYHDGILLFDISLNQVWDKASKDTVALTRYFEEHKKEYRWNEPRFKGYLIYAKDKESARRAQIIIKTANPDSVNSYIAHRINNDSVKLVRVEQGLWRKGQNPAVDKFGFKTKVKDYQPNEKYPVVMTCKGKVLRHPEVYTDERGKVTSDYQDQLEAEWVQQLRDRFEVVIDYDVFNRLKQQHP